MMKISLIHMYCSFVFLIHKHKKKKNDRKIKTGFYVVFNSNKSAVFVSYYIEKKNNDDDDDND